MSFDKLVDEGPVGQDKLLQEDEILTSDEKKKPDTTGDKEKPKKPCANCTCGLAEKSAASSGSGQPEETSKPAASSCGSCYLGDAFRCASCPYLGMPAFKPGEKVTIDDMN